MKAFGQKLVKRAVGLVGVVATTWGVQALRTGPEIEHSSASTDGDVILTTLHGMFPHVMSLAHDYQSWLCSITAAILIGLSGIFPLCVIPIEAGPSLQHGAAAGSLRLLLSFAVGSLLGDVFLHLLPEAWHLMELSNKGSSSNHLSIGLWVLAGIFTFIILEMMFSKGEETESQVSVQYTKDASFTDDAHIVANGNGIHHKATSHRRSVKNGGPVSIGNGRAKHQNGHARHQNGHANGSCYTNGSAVHDSKAEAMHNTKHITGYLNLLANCIDNFTHGLAVAGSFLVSFKGGMLTTFAILIHEIPHEIGDFAILLKSGFNRWEAAKAQVLTATVGLLGAVTALSFDSTRSLGYRTTWILPFTAGGFLNIALVNVLPDLLKERNARECVKQLVCLLAGVASMSLVTIFFE